MRLFIAVNLSEEQKKEVHTLQKRLQGYLEGVKWVSPRGLHLTIKFLGKTAQEQVDEIAAAMAKTAGQIGTFRTRFGESGVFPSPGKARVIWTGVQEGAENLQSAAKALDAALSTAGFQPEKRPYTPHLTLGRLRYPLKPDLINKFLQEESNFITTEALVTRLVLYESRLLRQGAEYIAVKEAVLHQD